MQSDGIPRDLTSLPSLLIAYRSIFLIPVHRTSVVVFGQFCQVINSPDNVAQNYPKTTDVPGPSYSTIKEPAQRSSSVAFERFPIFGRGT